MPSALQRACTPARTVPCAGQGLKGSRVLSRRAQSSGPRRDTVGPHGPHGHHGPHGSRPRTEGGLGPRKGSDLSSSHCWLNGHRLWL